MLCDVKRTALAVLIGFSFALPLPAQEAGSAATLVRKDNRVEVAGGNGAWSTAQEGQGLRTSDRLKTGEESRANVRMADGSVLQLDELTTIEIKPPKVAHASATLSVPSGAAYFFNQGSSREVQVETPSANGAIRGTAFLLTVNRVTGQTGVTMIQGAFELSNAVGRVLARQGEQASTGADGPGKTPYGDTGDTAPWFLVLEDQLPDAGNLADANKPAFLATIPSAIKQFRHVAPQLAGGATIVRKEWARDILREAFNAVGPDCAMRARILRSVIAAAPEQAAALTELAIELGPDCAGAFSTGGTGGYDESTGGFGAPPQNGAAPPGFGSGGGGQGNVVGICHNGRTIFVSPAGAENHLRNHLGDTVGPCQVTPTQNR